VKMLTGATFMLALTRSQRPVGAPGLQHGGRPPCRPGPLTRRRRGSNGWTFSSLVESETPEDFGSKPRLFSPKTGHQAPVLFISGFSKAAYNYFNYFGPWTADVQGPLLNSCVMKVGMTALAARPVKSRGVGVLACRLPHRPGACPILLGAHRPEPKAIPLVRPALCLRVSVVSIREKASRLRASPRPGRTAFALNPVPQARTGKFIPLNRTKSPHRNYERSSQRHRGRMKKAE